MAGTFYRTLDHLGSTRLITDQNGVDVSRHNFFPFGGEIPSTSGGTRNQVPTYNQPKGISQKFTGKERDDESKLDYFLARYYSAPMGRFLSVDQTTPMLPWMIHVAGMRTLTPETLL